MILSDAILSLRSRQKQQKPVFASALNVAVRTLTNYENGSRRPPREVLTALAAMATKEGHDDLALEFQLAVAEDLSPGEARHEGRCVFQHTEGFSPQGNYFDSLLWVTNDGFEQSLQRALVDLVNLSRYADDPAVRQNSRETLKGIIDAARRNEELVMGQRKKRLDER